MRFVGQKMGKLQVALASRRIPSPRWRPASSAWSPNTRCYWAS